ncbi:S8 family peptidase [Actinoplanes sp. G11-F43]|uniref:S8 family peptidase n=1 Tax=Actinoplanes sp. G11-F43 TaxID=3424130 RepID=UPI003D350830
MRKTTLGAALTAALAATALVAPSPAQAAAPQGRYIVTMKHRVSGFAARGVEAGDLVRSFSGLPGFVSEMTAAEARRVAADPNVRFVEPDRVVKLAGTQRNPVWGLDRIDQRAVKPSKSFRPSADGDTVHAYVIDTGIRIGHSQFGGRASYGYDFVGDDPVADDCNGHGTHVAGTIGGSTYGVAKKVKLVAVRVLNCAGEGYLSDIIDGVDWVTANAARPAVANMSLGGGNSPSLDYAVQDSIASGVTYVVAAGNENMSASLSSPADVPQAVTVAAVDSRDRRAPFSNHGPGVDLFAPGVDIRSATASSNTSTAKYSGTSMAAPHVAGAAALVLDANPGWSPARVQARLIGDATKGKVTDRKGSPNRLLFVPAPPKAPVIATGQTGTGSVGVGYSARLALKTARRGSWKLAAGSLPPGLSLSSSGVLSGTPTKAGRYTVSVRFTDYVPQAVTRRIVIPVVASTPVITTVSLPGVTAGDDYEQWLTVAGGREGVWTLESGALPDGLNLAGSGVLTGTATAAGEFTFTVRFTDAGKQTATRSYTVTVS